MEVWIADPVRDAARVATLRYAWARTSGATTEPQDDDFVDAVRDFIASEARKGTTTTELVEKVSAEAIASHLYTSGQPDPDLVIRTSGEQRLSVFLLWQSAYSEIWFTEAYWPEFRRVDFLRALRDYAARHRRFGA